MIASNGARTRLELRPITQIGDSDRSDPTAVNRIASTRRSAGTKLVRRVRPSPISDTIESSTNIATPHRTIATDQRQGSRSNCATEPAAPTANSTSPAAATDTTVRPTSKVRRHLEEPLDFDSTVARVAIASAVVGEPSSISAYAKAGRSVTAPPLPIAIHVRGTNSDTTAAAPMHAIRIQLMCAPLADARSATTSAADRTTPTNRTPPSPIAAAAPARGVHRGESPSAQTSRPSSRLD